MLPCKLKDGKEEGSDDEGKGGGDNSRKLLSFAEDVIWRRALASSSEKDYCAKYVSKIVSPFNLGKPKRRLKAQLQKVIDFFFFSFF